MVVAKRKLLTVMVLSALSAACASNATRQGYSTVLGPAEARSTPVLSSVSRYYVLGDNDGYYRPTLPRQQVAGPENQDVYNLRKQVQFLQRRLEAIESADVDDDSPQPASARARSSPMPRGHEAYTTPEPLPAPIPRPVLAEPVSKQGLTRAVAPIKTVQSGKIVRMEASTRLPKLPALPVLPLEANEESSGDSPKIGRTEIEQPAAPAVFLPTLPQIQPAAHAIRVAAHNRETPDSEETALQMAREIMFAAKKRVTELLGFAQASKTRNEASGEIVLAPALNVARPSPPAPEVAAAAAPEALPTKEWVVIYRLQDAKAMKRITGQLESLSMPPSNREFIDGDYVIEVGTFFDERRARARVQFLNEITKVAPELRVRAVMRAAQAAPVDGERIVH